MAPLTFPVRLQAAMFRSHAHNLLFLWIHDSTLRERSGNGTHYTVNPFVVWPYHSFIHTGTGPATHDFPHNQLQRSDRIQKRRHTVPMADVNESEVLTEIQTLVDDESKVRFGGLNL